MSRNLFSFVKLTFSCYVVICFSQPEKLTQLYFLSNVWKMCW